jgi:hypothetical protein
VGDDGYNGDGNDDGKWKSPMSQSPEPVSESGDDEPFPLDSEDKKLKQHACSDDGDTSFESMESVG